MAERKEDPVQSTNDVAPTNPAAKFTIPNFSINPDAPKPARRPETRVSVAIDIGDLAVNGDELIRLSALHVLAMGPDSGPADEGEKVDEKI